MPMCVDLDISFDNFMQVVYRAHEINPAEWKIKAKAIFIDSVQGRGVFLVASNINNQITFKGFTNSNSLKYLSSILYTVSNHGTSGGNGTRKATK